MRIALAAPARRANPRHLTLALASAALLSLAVAGGAARANTLSFVTDLASLEADDGFSWNNVPRGPMANHTPLLTLGGRGFSVWDPLGDLTVNNGPGFYTSHGGVDNYLQSPIRPQQTFSIDFDTPVTAFGAAPEWGGYQVATYTLYAYGAGHMLLGSGSTLSGSGGEPAFLGVVDASGANIASVTFTLTGSETHSSALGDLFLRDGAGAVPEPAAWALMLLGFGSAGAMLRRRRLAAA